MLEIVLSLAAIFVTILIASITLARDAVSELSWRHDLQNELIHRFSLTGIVFVLVTPPAFFCCYRAFRNLESGVESSRAISTTGGLFSMLAFYTCVQLAWLLFRLWWNLAWALHERRLLSQSDPCQSI